MQLQPFRVIADVVAGESVFVSGNDQALGFWQPNQSLQMHREKDNANAWTIEAQVSAQSLRYRYFVGIILWKPMDDGNLSRQVLVRRWESNPQPRHFTQNPQKEDLFGEYDNVRLISPGCLTVENCCLFSLIPNAISWYPEFNEKPTSFRVFVSPLEQTIAPENKKLQSDFEVAVLDENVCSFNSQSKEGLIYSSKYAMFRNYFLNQQIGLKLDLFRNNEKTPFASAFVLFDDQSPGWVKSFIHKEDKTVIGVVRAQYLIIRPFKDPKFNLESGLCTEFINFMRKGIHVGHRGCGTNRRIDLPKKILENTICSLNYAANHGADMVEFDVHLSKDDVPILYHDFSVYVNLLKKGPTQDCDTLELLVKDLTYHQLTTLKLKPTRDSKNGMEFLDSDPDENQPFCSLETALKTVNPCAFNIEIKYDTGKKAYSDLNHFVDTILRITYEHHNNRDIVFSSFDPDVCAMVCMKQSKFPVLFLTYTENRNKKCPLPDLEDDRMASVEMACFYSSAMSFLGINCFAQNLITEKTLIKYVISKDLFLFCYGDDINESYIVQDLIKEGVNGVCYDRIDIISPKKYLQATSGDSKETATKIPTSAVHCVAQNI